MYRIIKTELWKLKRYHIIWAGILLMLLSVGITLFASTALDGTVWTFPHLVERVIQNNTTTIFPMCITLIAGYIIAREKSDDTLKSIMTIPVSYPALIGGKLFVCGFLSVFLGMASTFFTVAAELLVGFPGFSVTAVIQALIQITLNTLFLYIAVTPIIAFTARIPNGHMVGVILAFVYGYGGMFAAGNMSLANLYRDKERDREGTPRPRLWPLPECFPDGRGTGRLTGQLSHCMGPVHRKAVRVHGLYRQAVSEPCRHHPALGR